MKRLQYDDVCDGQLISDSSPIKKSSKPLLIPELDAVNYNTYVLSSKIALIGTFGGIIFVRGQFTCIRNPFASAHFTNQCFERRHVGALSPKVLVFVALKITRIHQ